VATSSWVRPLLRPGLSLVGATLALIVFAASLTPTLLPRSGMFQGIVSGLCVVLAYGIGAALSAIARSLGARELDDRGRRRAWWALIAAAVVIVPVSLWLGADANNTTRDVMGIEEASAWDPIAIVVTVAVVAVLLIGIGRLLRLGAVAIARQLERWLSRRVSIALGAVLLAAIVYGLVDGVLLRSVMDGLDAAYSTTDRSTTEGFSAPASSLRSGSAESLVRWDSLGQTGRDFTGDGSGEGKLAGPSSADIEAFTDRPAIEPIRVYIGTRSADTLDERVELLLAELDRTGAFEREILAFYAVTGTGWIDERAADALEYMWDGDTASLGVQYSYLPSWISVLVDGDKAERTTGAALDAVLTRVSEIPEAERPRVVVFGESLGSYAVEQAFEDLDALRAEIDGSLLVGPTFGNPLHNRFTEARDEGSPAWRPVYEGGLNVRFAVAPDDLATLPGPWETRRVVYLQNGSDPVTYFSPKVFWARPEWLDDPRAPDVSEDMRWIPGVTFFQMLADLSAGFGAPVGHGHSYGPNVVDGWAAVTDPTGWSEADIERLRELVDNR
jgi:uncharacterized membrane protein